MPKRTNNFQRLIVLIEKSIRPQDASVTESKELVDKSTGKKRKIDILIELSDGIDTLIISIECKGGEKPRPATVEWVEQMKGKHLTLPTNKLILVSKGGFTEAAKKKAAWFDIATLSLSQAENSDWSSVVRELKTVEVISFLRPYVTGINVVFSGEPDEEFDLDQIDLPNSIIYDVNNSEQRTPQMIVERWLNDPALLEAVEREAYADGNTVISFQRRVKAGVFLIDRMGMKRPILAIGVKAKCRKEEYKVRMKQGTYRNVAIAHGKATNFGDSVKLLTVHQPEKDPQFTITMDRPKSTYKN